MLNVNAGQARSDPAGPGGRTWRTWRAGGSSRRQDREVAALHITATENLGTGFVAVPATVKAANPEVLRCRFMSPAKSRPIASEPL